MTTVQNLHQELEAIRPALLRFALLQLRNESQAEDAVQEALLAVLEKPDSYAGKSSFRTYVTGILKYKIIDILRSSSKEKQLPCEDDMAESDMIDSLFKANGHTVDTAHAWCEPDTELEQKDFFRVLEVCLDKLPAKTARVFMMREWLDLETEEICKELDLTTSNLWVLLFRARMRLRECLELNWFAVKTSS